MRHHRSTSVGTGHGMEQEATLVEEVEGVQEEEVEEVDVADTVQPGRLFSYSSEDDDDETEEKMVWEKRLRKKSRFVTRLEMSRRGERLDMGTFTPLCTSERLGRGGEVLLKRTRGEDCRKNADLPGPVLPHRARPPRDHVQSCSRIPVFRPTTTVSPAGRRNLVPERVRKTGTTPLPTTRHRDAVMAL